MAPRVLRMVAVVDVEVNASGWSERQVRDAVTTLFSATGAFTTGAALPNPSSIEINTFRVHTLGEAYEILLRSP